MQLHPPESMWSRPDAPLAAPLVADLGREYDARYGLNDGVPSSVELQRYPASLFDPEHGGAFLLLIVDGQAVAGGGFLRTDEATVEVKRIWTHHDFRRQGLARRVLTELESEAVRRGHELVVLTTGARQPEALALYLAHGYEPLFDLDGDLEHIGYLHFRKAL